LFILTPIIVTSSNSIPAPIAAKAPVPLLLDPPPTFPVPLFPLEFPKLPFPPEGLEPIPPALALVAASLSLKICTTPV